MGGTETGRLLMMAGAVLFLLGALVAAGGRLPLGRLPGDIVVKREGGTFYFPVVTCLLVSVLLSLLLRFLRR